MKIDVSAAGGCVFVAKIERGGEILARLEFDSGQIIDGRWVEGGYWDGGVDCGTLAHPEMDLDDVVTHLLETDHEWPTLIAGEQVSIELP